VVKAIGGQERKIENTRSCILARVGCLSYCAVVASSICLRIGSSSCSMFSRCFLISLARMFARNNAKINKPTNETTAMLLPEKLLTAMMQPAKIVPTKSNAIVFFMMFSSSDCCTITMRYSTRMIPNPKIKVTYC